MYEGDPGVYEGDPGVYEGDVGMYNGDVGFGRIELIFFINGKALTVSKSKNIRECFANVKSI